MEMGFSCWWVSCNCFLFYLCLSFIILLIFVYLEGMFVHFGDICSYLFGDILGDLILGGFLGAGGFDPGGGEGEGGVYPSNRVEPALEYPSRT